MTRSRWLSGALAWLVLPWMLACFSSDPTGGDEGDNDLFGTIVASTTTTGPSPDPDGYTVRLDEGRVEPIAVNGSVTFSELPPSSYQVLLEGNAPNCVIAGSNPVHVMLLADSLRTAAFELTCS